MRRTGHGGCSISGCGLGSVLLTLAWKMPHAELVGVEAQEMSYELVRRNLARSGFSGRVTVHHGDLRDAETRALFGAPFDLVTGTPPYFDADAALSAVDPQREFARLEHRGGVEDYLAAGATALAPEGVMVLCGDARADERVRQGALLASLVLSARCQVIPRAGRAPLFSVWTLRPARRGGEPCAPAESSLLLRDEAGGVAEGAQQLRAFSGFAPHPQRG